MFSPVHPIGIYIPILTDGQHIIPYLTIHTKGYVKAAGRGYGVKQKACKYYQQPSWL